MAESPTRIELRDIDGIPAWYAPADGPSVLSVTFRVGQADERLPSHGLTHLTEHLAIWQLGQVPYGNNGYVNHITTGFAAWGRLDEATGFIRDLSKALPAAPAERVTTEAGILLTEARGRQPNAIQMLLRLQFGAQAYGIGDFDEYALNWADARDCDAWSRLAFTRENAVLTISGPWPSDLRIELPHGERLPTPAVRPLPHHYPIAFEGPHGLVAMGGLCNRTVVAAATVQVSARRLQYRLRSQMGASYSVNGSYLPLGRDLAHWALMADCQPHDAGRIAAEMVQTLTGFSGEPVKAAELDFVAVQIEHAQADPGTRHGELHGAAVNTLVDFPVESPESVAAEFRLLTPEELADTSEGLLTSAILVYPPGGAPPDPFRRSERRSRRLTPGKRFAPRQRYRGSPTLDVSDDGIAWAQAGRQVVIAWQDAFGLWGTGGVRTIVDSDGSWIEVNPSGWRNPIDLVQKIDSAIIPERWAPTHRVDSYGKPALLRLRPPRWSG